MKWTRVGGRRSPWPRANNLPKDCAGGALTHDDLECKKAITSTHHHGMTSLPGFDGWADDVTGA
jgi:hypothetical protein